VYSGTFTKQSGGTIYRSNEDSALRNTAANGDGYGHAVYVDYGSKKRNGTAGSSVTLDSGTSGADGGWVDQYTVTFYADGGSSDTQTLTVNDGDFLGIIYSSVSGGTWALLGDGRRQSPAIGYGEVTKARVSFTSTVVDASITIQLDVSSESGCDYAFISTLDNASATYSSGYYTDSRISGEQSVTVTIPVPSPGDHFIDIGYWKDGSVNNGSDCAWFKVTSGDAAMPTEPTKSDYTFGGWWTSPNGGGTEFTAGTITADITVYAKWL
jgi:uncharacterized repeat protein (TIGR02543 family)